MPAPVSDLLAEAFADRGIDLLRLSAGEMRRLRPLLDRLERELATRLMEADLSATNASLMNTVLSDARALIANRYSAVSSELNTMLTSLISNEASFVVGTINQIIGVSIANALAPSTVLKALLDQSLVLGAPSADWWARQSGSLAFRFAQQMRLGIAQGETNGDLIRRVRGTKEVPGIMEASRREAEALVRTSVQTVANHARLETFRQNADVIKGVQQLSTLDLRTSDICIAYSDQTWDLDGKPIMGTTLPFNDGPPRHWNCRSKLIAIMKSWKELGSKYDIPEFKGKTRASMDGAVASDMTFDRWLSGKSAAQQDKLLGKGRAELYRAGKLTLQELLDQRGRPLTLQQLKTP